MNTSDYRVILTKEQIEKRVKELALTLSKDYEGKTPVMICMLKGAIYFFSDLSKNMTTPIMIEFARLSSYKNGMDSGEMELISDITADINGKDVILVEDIVDSGKTLSYLCEYLTLKGAKSVKTVTLLDKPSRREVDFVPDYTGKQIPDEFVIGYGLDYDEKYRALPYVGILKREVYSN